jgi:hypothetical protein
MGDYDTNIHKSEREHPEEWALAGAELRTLEGRPYGYVSCSSPVKSGEVAVP